MTELPIESADTQIPPFPWLAVGTVAVFAMLFGVALALAFAVPSLRWTDLLEGLGIGGVAVVTAWRALESAVQEWRQAFRTSVEYSARRQREREAGIRFLAP